MWERKEVLPVTSKASTSLSDTFLSTDFKTFLTGSGTTFCWVAEAVNVRKAYGERVVWLMRRIGWERARKDILIELSCCSSELSVIWFVVLFIDRLWWSIGYLWSGMRGKEVAGSEEVVTYTSRLRMMS